MRHVRLWTGVSLIVVLAVGFAVAAGMQQQNQRAMDLVQKGISDYQAGNTVDATKAFDQALGENKQFPPAVYGKAALQFIDGKFGDSQGTLQAYMNAEMGGVQGNMTDPYAWMWAYIAMARTQGADRAMLTDMQALVSGGSWFGQTVNLFLGQTPPDKYMTAVMEMNAGPDMAGPMTVRSNFMVGEALLTNGKAADSRKYFQAAADAPGSFQWDREMAKAELKRIK